jgi:hypothetical protein
MDCVYITLVEGRGRLQRKEHRGLYGDGYWSTVDDDGIGKRKKEITSLIRLHSHFALFLPATTMRLERIVPIYLRVWIQLV